MACTSAQRDGHEPILGSFTPGGMAFLSRATTAPHCADLAQGAVPPRGGNPRVLHKGNGWPLAMLPGLAARFGRNVGGESPLARPARHRPSDLRERAAQPCSSLLAHPGPQVRLGSACPSMTKSGVSPLSLAIHAPLSRRRLTSSAWSGYPLPIHTMPTNGDPPGAFPSGPRPAVMGRSLAPLLDFPQDGLTNPLSHPPPSWHVEARGWGAVRGPLPAASSVVVRDADRPGPGAVTRTPLAPAVPPEGAQ